MDEHGLETDLPPHQKFWCDGIRGARIRNRSGGQYEHPEFWHCREGELPCLRRRVRGSYRIWPHWLRRFNSSRNFCGTVEPEFAL
ncbi:hypothetical protein A2Y83_03535 [Candidatus Falkowbacteria bacterium RBG_13_39_14]|uniref:Uncharacterized protein n=1 Tax=Candidatus Falkowbacteria bacterium RBG_13_39_14 TaxID=1797985 RepID=A0A1F5S5X8_9BACT|nr:MAG: hypothetical protein A2Y83_03535 [Candidatus Falkowbacteria bacterium RBG_13_39_14]